MVGCGLHARSIAARSHQIQCHDLLVGDLYGMQKLKANKSCGVLTLRSGFASPRFKGAGSQNLMTPGALPVA
jgi:hypothetical protein